MLLDLVIVLNVVKSFKLIVFELMGVFVFVVIVVVFVVEVGKFFVVGKFGSKFEFWLNYGSCFMVLLEEVENLYC